MGRKRRAGACRRMGGHRPRYVAGGTGICGFWDGSYDNGRCEEALSSWPSWNTADGFSCTKSVAECLLTVYNNGWKSAPAKSVQLFDHLRIEI